MNLVNEIVNYFNDAKIMYLGTVNDGKPKVRPIGFAMECEDKVYFTTGEKGSIYNELQNNPYFEVTVMHPTKPFHRIRFSAKAKFDATESTLEKFYELQPMMKEMEGTTLFSADDWEVIFYEGMQEKRIERQIVNR